MKRTESPNNTRMSIDDLVQRAKGQGQGQTPWAIVQAYSVEISGETYFRRPHEMLETPMWWKMQCVEALARQMRSDITGHNWAPL